MPYKVDKILEFIQRFKMFDTYNILEDIYMNGFCYYFAKMLERNFSGCILYDAIDNHFVFMYTGEKFETKCYDVTGEVELNGRMEPWGTFADSTQKSIITRDCILKNPRDKELTIKEFIDLFKEKNKQNVIEATFGKIFAEEFAEMLKIRFPHGSVVETTKFTPSPKGFFTKDDFNFYFLYCGKYYSVFGEE